VAETLINQQEQKLDQGADTQRQNIFLKKIVGVVLSIVMIALTIYVLNLQDRNYSVLSRSTDMALTASDHATVNYRTYVGRYKETKVELDQTIKKLEVVKGQLDQVSTELATTKGMLAQTQGMLSQAQEENTNLKRELQGLDELRISENVQNIGELQVKIKALKDRDSKISLQLESLKKQLRAFQGEFSGLDEGQSLIVLFQNKIRLVKSRMHSLKQEAFFARVAAQKEKDRVASLNGNSGFMVRNGQIQNPNGTKKSFAIEVKIEQ
jgi:chromosome segregation ATPase